MHHYVLVYVIFCAKLCEGWIKYKGLETHGMESYIHGKVDVDIEMFPHVAQVTMFSVTLCGGSVVSSRVILTSAHCISDYGEPIETANLHVYLGSAQAYKGKRYKISKVYPHPMFGPNKYDYYFYDIGLMLLSQNIKFSSKVQIGQIVPDKYNWRRSKHDIIITGFGPTQSKDNLRMQLKMAHMKYIDRKTCNQSQTADDSMPAPYHMFCLEADRWTRDCFAESGSSVNWGKYIVGVISAGRDVDCGSNTMPSMFTDVTYFKSWIKNSIKKLESSTYGMKKMAPLFHSGLVGMKQIFFKETAQVSSTYRSSKERKMEGFIIGGVDADIQMYPHTAQIARKRGTTFCGGSVISDQVILTAAHCLVNQLVVINPKRLIVYLGSDVRDSGIAYTVSEILIHPGYNSDTVYIYFYDIALMLLSKKITFSNKVKKGKIISHNSWRNTRYTMTIAGFGAMASQVKGSLPLHLKMTRMKYVDSIICNRSQTGDNSVMPVPNHMFCMKADKWTSDCFGDSGSSVNWRIYIVGIVAVGRDFSCGSEVMPSMYTDVTYFKDWIDQSISLLESSQSDTFTDLDSTKQKDL